METFINTLNWIVQFFILIYFCMVFIAGLLTWRYPHLFSADESSHRALRFIYRTTAPLFAFIHKILPSKLINVSGYDLAPLLALLLLLVLTLLLSPFFIAWSPLALLPV